MYKQVEVPNWIVGCRVELAPNAPDKAINELGKLPGSFSKYFGEAAHVEPLPLGHRRSATLFYEQFEPQRLEVVHEAALIICSLTAHLSAKTQASLHIGSFLEFGRRRHDEALFADLPDYSDALVPEQRLGLAS